MTAGDRFVAAARRYLRAPFRHFGRTPAGLDCVGLLLLAARDAGIPADDPGKYAKGRRGFDVRAWLRDRLDDLPADAAARDGDVLLFADGIYPAHVGIASTLHLLPHVIHAHLRGGMVVEEPFAHDLARSYRAAFRLREG